MLNIVFMVVDEYAVGRLDVPCKVDGRIWVEEDG
jgi:head-tail adaptor